MDKSKGMAYCGLACCLCGQDCAGCRTGGGTGHEWCENFNCCREKGLDGCWQCGDFPCGRGLLAKVKPRAFCAYIAAYGEEALTGRLEECEKNGVVYHREGVTGDYDTAGGQREIFALLRRGAPASKDGD